MTIDEKRLDVIAFEEGIGLAGTALENLQLKNNQEIEKVITIENLNTFLRWKENKSLMIYLGGYHNGVRRRFLQTIYESNPNADYLHFGDIDCNGFRIYEDLCKRTEIPFKTYHMDCEMFRKYPRFSKSLSVNDKKILNKMIKNNPNVAYMDVLQMMLKTGKKLEQDCMSVCCQ